MSELIVFELGGRRMVARSEGVDRIASKREADEGWAHGTALGVAVDAAHGLVVARRALAVDRVLGLRHVPGDSIHPLPRLAAEVMEAEGIGGLVDLEGELVLLVDVPALLPDVSKPLQEQESPR